MLTAIVKNRQYYKFSLYGFLKNLRFFEAFFMLYLIGKGLSYTQIGTLYALREIFIYVFEVPSGIIADTFGRKRTLAGSFVVYILSFIMFFLSDHYWALFIAFALYGMGDSFRSGTHKGMIMDYLRIHNWEDEKIAYYGHTRSWSQMGAALSSLAAGLIIFMMGSYEKIFLFSIIPYFINFLLILSYPPELNLMPEASSRSSLRHTSRSLLTSLRQPGVLKVLHSSASHSAYIKAVKDYIQPLMVQLALLFPLLTFAETKNRTGLIVGVIYFVIYLLSSAASRHAADVVAINKRRISTWTLVLGFSLGIATGLLYNGEFWLASLLTFIGIFLVENTRKPILTGFVSDLVPNEILTSVLSAQSLLKTILTVVLALILGVVADHWGLGYALILVSALLLSSLVFIPRQR